MGQRANINKLTEVTLASAVSSIAFPTGASDGADISRDSSGAPNSAGGVSMAGKWKLNGTGDVDAAVFVVSSAAMSLSGGVGLYGYRTDLTKWFFLGPLNGGSAITTLGANTGFSAVVEFAGIYDRLAVGPLTSTAVTPSTGTVTVTACQIRQNFDMHV